MTQTNQRQKSKINIKMQHDEEPQHFKKLKRKRGLDSMGNMFAMQARGC